MARLLQTTSKKIGAEYPRLTLPMTGGLNPDAGDLIPPEDFSELHNMRKVVADEYELRTGYERIDADATHNGTPEWKTEYIVYDDALNVRYYYDVTVASMFEGSGDQKIFVQLINKLTGVQEYIDVVGGLPSIPLPIAVAGQFQFMLLVSVYGNDTFAIYPQAYTPVPGNWKVQSVGKVLALGPEEVSFMEKTEGDLIIFASDNDAPGAFHDMFGYRRVADDNGRLYVPKTDLNEPNRFTNGENHYRVHLPVKSPYFRRDLMQDTGLTPPMPDQQWVFPPTDADVKVNGNDAHVSSEYHMQTRGWGYKLVLVREIVDPNGNKTVVYSAPSTDFWVKDTIYCPPQLWITTEDRRPWKLRSTDPPFPPPTLPQGYYITYPDPNSGTGQVEAFPSPADMKTLLLRLIDYFGLFEFGTTSSGGPGYPVGGFYGNFALWWAGYRQKGVLLPDSTETNFNTLYFEGEPYWCQVPASYLKGAPMTVIAWDDIKETNGGDNSIVEALIYRTAYCCPTEDDNDTWSPLFEPHKYGYVGSVKNPGLISSLSIFEDIVPDGEIDFSNTPEQYEGYLEGQLSGQVYTEYNAQAVFANLKTFYWVNDPERVVGSSTGGYILFEPRVPLGVDPYTGADFATGIGFGYQYIDSDGNRSDITTLYRRSGPVAGGATEVHIGFTIPYGYAPNITAVRIWRLAADLTPLKIIKELSVTDGYYIHTTKDDEKDPPSGQAEKNIVVSTAPGSSVRSDLNTIFRVSALNTELHHNIYQVLHMNVIMGRLWIFTDGSVSLTELNGRRAEPESPNIGLVNRYAAVKVDKVIVFLSQDGLYYMEASGPVLFPAKIQTEILKYLEERYDEYPRLTGVRNATFGFNGTRNELWMHFPKTTEYGGVLEHKTFVMKFLNTAEPAQNVVSTFDLSKQFIWEELSGNTDRYSRIVTYAKPERVVFGSHSDGSLFASYLGTRPAPSMPLPPDTDLDIMVTLDCDHANEVWRFRAMAEKKILAGEMNLPKFLREVVVKLRKKSNLIITTGMGSTDALPYQYLYGHVNELSTDYLFTFPEMGAFETRSHTPVEIIERRGRVVYIRLKSIPDDFDDHDFALKSMSVFMAITNAHA